MWIRRSVRAASAWPALWLSLAGLGTALFGCILVDRTIRFLRFQERVQQDIESELKLPMAHTLSHGMKSPYFKEAMGEHSWPAKSVLRAFLLVSVLAWLVAAIVISFRILPVSGAVGVTNVLFLVMSSLTGCITTALSER